MSFSLFSLMSFDDTAAYDFEAMSFDDTAAYDFEAMALREKNQVQITKSTIYRAKYEMALNEDGFARAVRMLEAELKAAKAPSKQVLQIVTARLYHNYLQSNLYKIQQRTALQLDDDKEPENWSVNIFAHKIRSLIHAAVEDPQQTNYPLADYREIIRFYRSEHAIYKPTLYDLVVDEAITILNTIESFEVQASYMFSLTDKDALGDLDKFLAMNIETQDTNSSVFSIISIKEIKNEVRAITTTLFKQRNMLIR